MPGWVALPDWVDPEDLEALTLQVVAGQVLEYRCPVCPNRVRLDVAGIEPCCTGPGYTDEHPMEVMVLVEPERARTAVGF